MSTLFLYFLFNHRIKHLSNLFQVYIRNAPFSESLGIHLENDVHAKEFKVIIPTTIQKNVLKDSNTIQKNLDANQKRVLEYFRNNPKGTRVEVANALGNIIEDGVKFIIGRLQQKGLLKRVGGRKHGEWQVLI